MYEKLLMLLTATMMSLSVFIGSTQPGIASSLGEATINPDGEKVQIKTPDFDNSGNLEDNISIQSNLWQRYLEAVFSIGSYISNKYYTVPAKGVSIPGAVGTTTGTLQFSDDNSFAETRVQLENTYDTIYAFGKIDTWNSYSKKIGIAIYQDRTGTRMVGKNVISNEGVSIRNVAKGGYTVVYNVQDPVKWNLGVFYFFNSPPCTQCIPYEDPQPHALSDEQKNEMFSQYYFENNMTFTIPQQEAFKEKNRTARIEKSFLTINDLKNDSFDENLQEYVQSLKSFNIGDSIFINDTITDIYYDSDTRTTSLGFDYYDKTDSNERTKVYWEFAGDLRNQFFVGNSISFKVQVVPISRDLNLETLDILGYQAKVVPNIDNYLLSNLEKIEEPKRNG